MKTLGRCLVMFMVICSLALSVSVTAAPMVFNNEAALRAAAGLTTTYGFETHGVVEGMDLASPLTAAQLDNNFNLAYTNLNVFRIIDNGADAGVADGTHYLFTHSVFPATNYTLTFANFGGSNTPITAFGLTITDFASNLTGNDPPVSITYDTGTLTGTLLTVAAGQPDFTQNFIGVIVDNVDAFTAITLTLDDNLSGFQDFDEVIYASATAIPEPSTWLLLATGCLGLLAYGWRRQRRAA